MLKHLLLGILVAFSGRLFGQLQPKEAAVYGLTLSYLMAEYNYDEIDEKLKNWNFDYHSANEGSKYFVRSPNSSEILTVIVNQGDRKLFLLNSDKNDPFFVEKFRSYLRKSRFYIYDEEFSKKFESEFYFFNVASEGETKFISLIEIRESNNREGIIFSVPEEYDNSIEWVEMLISLLNIE